MRWNLSWTAAIGMRAAKPFKPMRMADIVSVFDYATLQIRVMQQKMFNKQRGRARVALDSRDHVTDN